MNITKKLSKDYSYISFCNHNHFGGTPRDAVAPTSAYVDASIEAGYKKVAITEHGGFTCMQTAYDYIAEREIPLNIVYGLEAYIEVPPFAMNEKAGHMILLAVDEQGKHIIDKLNSNAEGTRLGSPVISRKQLESIKFDGHVIATSACISGAPSLALLYNDITNNNINKIIEKRNKMKQDKDGSVYAVCLAPDNYDYLSVKDKLEKAEAELKNLYADKDNIDAVNEFKANKAQLRKDTKAGLNTAELEKKISDYNVHIAEVKNKIAVAKKSLTAIRKEYKYYAEKVDAWNSYEDKINELKASQKSEEKLYEKCIEELKYFNNLFGENNYYAEVQYHGMPDEKMLYPIVAKAARELHIPLIAANDAHMPTKDNKWLVQRNVARALRFNKVDEQEWDKELYIKTPNELAEAILQILPEDMVDEAMNNLNVVGNRCCYIPQKINHYPIFDKNKDSNVLLAEEIKKGIKWRFPKAEDWTKERQDRIDYEYGIITSMGFADYHLIVKDFLEYGRIVGKIPEELLSEVPLTIEGAKKYVEEHNFKVGTGIGPGRGSGAGSLVTYLLGITNIDPFKYGLIFERFLNPERITMPKQNWAFSVNSITQRCA